MKLAKRLLSILLIVVMSFSFMTINAFAADVTVGTEAELIAAISGASEGDTIVLSNDIDMNDPLTIDNKVTIDLAGYELNFTDLNLTGAADAAVKVKADVTVKNGTINVTHDASATSKFSAVVGSHSESKLKLDVAINYDADAISKAVIRAADSSTLTVIGGDYTCCTAAEDLMKSGSGSLVIKGGKFGFDPSAYVHSDFSVYTADSVTWEVEEKTFVAEYNGAKYTAFADAIDAAGGNTITLLSDGDGKSVPNNTGKAFKMAVDGSYTVDYDGADTSATYTVLGGEKLFSVDKDGYIIGGLFYSEVDAADMPENYKCVEVETNKYEVTTKGTDDAIATVNSTMYFAWDKAVDASNTSGQPIILMKPVTLAAAPAKACSIQGKSAAHLTVNGYDHKDGEILKFNDAGEVIGGVFVTNDLAGLKSALPTAAHYNYEPNDKENPTEYKVIADSYKARIGSTNYFAVADAIADAGASDTVTILDAYELKNPSGSFKMDPNGKELKVTFGARTYTVKSGPLVIKGGLIAGGTFNKEINAADIAAGYICKKSGANWIVEQDVATVEIVLGEGESASGMVVYYKNETVNGKNNKNLVFKVSGDVYAIYADYNAESGSGTPLTFTKDAAKNTVTIELDSNKNNSELEALECVRHTLTFEFSNGQFISKDKTSGKPIYLYVWPDIDCPTKYVHGDDTLHYITVTISDPNDFPINDTLYYWTAADGTVKTIKTNSYKLTKSGSSWIYEIDKAFFDDITPGTLYLGFRYEDDCTYGYGINIYPEPYMKALDGGSTAHWSKSNNDLQLQVNPSEITTLEIRDSNGNVIRTIPAKHFKAEKGVLTIDDSELSSLKYNTAYIIWADTINGEASIPLSVGPGLSVKGNSSHTKGGSNNLVFTATDKVDSVYIDGSSEKLASKHFSISSDGLTITLKAAYLNTLAVGTHSIKVSGPNGTATTNFKIISPGTASSTPSTGDTSNIGLYIGLLAASAVIVAAGIIIYKKTKKTDRGE